MVYYAGFWVRFVANVLDGLIIALPLLILCWIITGNFYTDWPNFIYGLYALLLPVFFNGKTIGKHICGIRIAKKDSLEAPSIWTMIKRNIIFAILGIIGFGLIYILDALFLIFREDKRALHDIVAGTVVIEE